MDRREVAAYWKRCWRIARRNNSAFANDWQWVYGTPPVAALFGWLASRYGAAQVTASPILDAFLVALLAFAITWLVSAGRRLIVAPVQLDRGLRNKAAFYKKQVTAFDRPQPITIAALVKLARERYSWSMTAGEDEMDFMNGLRQAHGVRFTIQGQLGLVGGHTSEVLFQTRLHTDIPNDHFHSFWIYSLDESDNTKIYTDHPSKIVPERDRYGNLRINDSARALLWLEKDAGQLRGAYRQAANAEQARREARDKQIGSEQQPK